MAPQGRDLSSGQAADTVNTHGNIRVYLKHPWPELKSFFFKRV